MAREPINLELEGEITIESTPLSYERSEDLLPDMIALGGLAITHAGDALDMVLRAIVGKSLKAVDVTAVTGAFGPLMSALSEKLGAGKLKQLSPLLLNGTVLVYPDAAGKKIRQELSSKTDRATAFEDHPELYFIALGFAAKVTFARYFPAIGPLVTKLKSLMMMVPSHQSETMDDSQSRDSNPST